MFMTFELKDMKAKRFEICFCFLVSWKGGGL